jgi:hypothetical protein
VTHRKLSNWLISSPENPSGYHPSTRSVNVCGADGPGYPSLTTSAVVEVLRSDQRMFRTKSGSIYELVGDPFRGWAEEAGASGIDDFAPFDVSVFGVAFLSEPTRGRIRRNGDDWLWFARRNDDGLWTARCVEDRPTMVRVAEPDMGYHSIAEARESAVDAMQKLYAEAGGKRPAIVGRDGVIAWMDEPS